MSHKWVGSSVARKEGWEKVTGQAKYIDDIEFPEMIHGITIRTAVARGVLKKISDVVIIIKSYETSIIQECHMSILHAICLLLDKEL